MTKLVEVRSYRLHSGRRADFHALFAHDAMPLLAAAGIDVVSFGPSVGEADSYYLIRCFDDREHRRQAEERFYASAAWRQGPREKILALIETYTEAVFLLSEIGVNALRTQAQPQCDE